jgi:hypothetical protein
MHGKHAPADQHHATFLTYQSRNGGFLLHQHVVQQQNDAMLHLVDQPDRRRKTGCDGLRNLLQEKKRGLCCHSPDYSR